jgi:RNA polymerase sigma factor (sigma-70 family)
MADALTALNDAVRECVPDVVAALVRRYGDFDAAEDATQEALLDAARQWPDEGTPEYPRGWLIRVASRRLVDRLRSDQARVGREEAVAARVPPQDRFLTSADDDAVPHRDDSLTLLLLCCHPALTPPSRVALTLRAVAGLGTAQIARAFLVPEATMAQRIARAKARLRQTGARFELPDPDRLANRIASASHVLYLIFTEAHTATTGSNLSDPVLAEEAIRLARRLHERLPAADEVTGLLALMLLTHARHPARTNDRGDLMPLAEQDRTLWDRAMIDEGVRLIDGALPEGPVGPYQLQAAIAAVHAEAERADDTDWTQIQTLYQMLEGIAPSPVVTLNRAVAVAMTEGPSAALALVEPLMADPGLRRSHRIYAVRAHLLEMDGRIEEARAAYALAGQMATSIPEQRYLICKSRGPVVTSRRVGTARSG